MTWETKGPWRGLCLPRVGSGTASTAGSGYGAAVVSARRASRATAGACSVAGATLPVVAGPPNATPAAQAALVPADAVREFLKANSVNVTSSGSSDAKASVVRVICVRK